MELMRFVDEFPEIKKLFEELFKKRSRDEWYIEKCKEKILFPDLNHLKSVEIVVFDRHQNPSEDVRVYIKDIQTEGGVVLKQSINVVISKIIPVYSLLSIKKLNHQSLPQEIVGENGLDTEEIFEVVHEIEEFFSKHNYIRLYEEDLYDTVYNWEKVPKLDSLGRSLTVKTASFYDVLALCD